MWRLQSICTEFLFLVSRSRGTKHIPTFLLLSKAWYQFANHEAVWRKIALLMCKGDCFYEHSWKYTTQLVLLKRKRYVESICN